MFNISPELLKRAFLPIAITIIICTGMALAQTPTADQGMVAPNTAETNTMDGYLNDNPRVAKELHDNPALLNDPKWLSEHPKVQNWMNSHPSMKADAATHPGQFVNQTERHDMMVDHRALNSTDAFMKNHPKVAEDLKNNPKLIDDPNYLAKHPQLDSYLAKNPAIRREWQEHPKEFTRAAEQNYKYNQARHSPTAHPGPAHAKPAARR